MLQSRLTINKTKTNCRKFLTMEIKITPKQLEILHLLYRFRFLNRHHIQSFLNHKDPKRINEWLKDLTSKQIIGRNYSKKLGENIQPAIYYLSSKSHRILKEQDNIDKRILKRVYRERLRSGRLIDHHLLLADIYFYLQSQAKESNQELHFFTKTDLTKHTYLPYQRPDAYIALKAGKDEVKRYFLEILDPDTPRFALRKKISDWCEYFDDNTWQETTQHHFPSILIVTSSESVKYFLNHHISQVLESEMTEIDFYLSTVDAITASEMRTNIWQKVVIKD